MTIGAQASTPVLITLQTVNVSKVTSPKRRCHAPISRCKLIPLDYQSLANKTNEILTFAYHDNVRNSKTL